MCHNRGYRVVSRTKSESTHDRAFGRARRARRSEWRYTSKTEETAAEEANDRGINRAVSDPVSHEERLHPLLELDLVLDPALGDGEGLFLAGAGHHAGGVGGGGGGAGLGHGSARPERAGCGGKVERDRSRRRCNKQQQCN